MSKLLPTAPASPVIRFVVVLPAPALNKAVKALADQEAVAEVRRALNAWAYEGA
jgi:hypothetical protein